MARDREKNREKAKETKREESLEKCNEYGLKDLTPYNAIRVMNGKEIAFR
jgi:hypothetical protein